MQFPKAPMLRSRLMPRNLFLRFNLRDKVLHQKTRHREALRLWGKVDPLRLFLRRHPNL